MTKGSSSPFLKQCFVTSAVGINLIGHGSLSGFPAVLLPQFQQPDSEIVSSKTADSWIASVMGITLLIGSFMATVMERYGRKMVHYIVSASAVLGWFITVFANNVEVILVARIIGGLSFGMMLPLRSILIGEYTSPKNRGAFLTTISLTQGSGVFFVHLIGSFLSWRKTALVSLFLPLTSFIMTFLMPESPSWLVSKGKYDECRTVFRWLRGDQEEEELEAMVKASVELKKKEQKNTNVFTEVRKPEFYKPIILMLHMYAMPQLSGAALNAAYATTIITHIMNPSVNADAWMLVIDSERLIVNTLAIFIINKMKRRTMVFATLSLCIFSLIAIAVYVYLKDSGFLTHDILWIPGTLMIMQFFSVSVGMVPLPSVIAGEVFPLEYRSIAGTISLASIAGFLFVVLKTFPALIDGVGISGTYFLYAGMLVYCMVVIWFMLPETKGKTLQDIEDECRGKVKKVTKDGEELKALKSEKEENEKTGSV
ncbi:facilitated trehalose transporter Tret1-like [Anticarsia gemmatalis]|uniref:facilitated trehalose transporter Tret1-like n=1 Tax=Anticarsia gemmatalis TaxID=129554 RepID=UPI003F776722